MEDAVAAWWHVVQNAVAAERPDVDSTTLTRETASAYATNTALSTRAAARFKRQRSSTPKSERQEEEEEHEPRARRQRVGGSAGRASLPATDKDDLKRTAPRAAATRGTDARRSSYVGTSPDRAGKHLRAPGSETGGEAVRPPTRSLFLQGPGVSELNRRRGACHSYVAAGGGFGIPVMPVVLAKKSVSPREAERIDRWDRSPLMHAGPAWGGAEA